MRYLFAVGMILLLFTPAWSQVRGLPTLAETSYTSDGITLSVKVNRPHQSVLMTFSKKDGTSQTVTLDAREWRHFCRLYRAAVNGSDNARLAGVWVIGEVPGDIKVSLDVPYVDLYAPFPGTISPLTPDTRVVVPVIVVSHGDMSVQVSQALTWPLDSVIDTAQREMGTAADSSGP